jgi:TolB protein
MSVWGTLLKTLLRIWAIVLLTIVALVTVARRDFSGAWIAFASDRDGVRSIYLMSGDGGSVRRISTKLTCATAPQWSANGRWVAFSNPCAVPQDFLRIRLGGGGLQAISSVPSFADSTRWSPDREQVVVMRSPSSLYILRVDGSGERYLAADYYFPQWSPDGNWIYARPLFNDRSSLDRLHVQTGEVQSLLPPRTVFSILDWSPDTQRMVIAMPTEQGDELFTMNPDGSKLTMISSNLPEPLIHDPIWSPDGEWIAFVGGNRRIEQSIYRIRPDGTNLQSLSQRVAFVQNLQWSSDSQWLLFGATVDGDEIIYRLRADDSSLQDLAPGPGDDLMPQYAPVSGLGWRPFWLMTIAVLMGVASLRRSSPQ